MDILETLTARAGQSQEGRLPAELEPRFARIEERSAPELLAYARALAARVPYFVAAGDSLAPDGNWAAFLEGALPRARDGKTAPHLALFAAFLKLYRVPRSAANAFTARHLEFFYQRVLGFEKRAPRPDRAHLLLELKKGTEPVELAPAHAFSAGKGAAGAELLYAPTGRTVINHARVERLGSIYVDPADGGSLRFAPEAASADGLGAKLQGAQPKWPPFGMPREQGLPRAPLGFAVASPVLRMKEGTRRIVLTLELAAAEPAVTSALLEQRLECFVTGEKGWLGPYALDAEFPAATTLKLTCTVAPGEAAIADYDAAKHEHAFAARAPVLQILLKDGQPHGYELLRALRLKSAALRVEASDLRALQLESDSGALDPRRAFQPFGHQPVIGTRFMVGCPEALSKRLVQVTLKLHWLGLPSGFALARTSTVGVALRDATGAETAADRDRLLFGDPQNEIVSLVLTPGEPAEPAGPQSTPHSRRVWQYTAGGSAYMHIQALRVMLARPVYTAATAAPQPRAGFITLKLQSDFGHATYRSMLTARSTTATEPYTPTLSEISLSYVAQTLTARIASDEEADFAAAELDFFHVGAFGQRREHGFLRSQFDFAPREMPLLPEYDDEGELLIGLSGIKGGDSVSLLFQVAEGSADPDAKRQPVAWAVLCDNYWKPLIGGDGVSDRTNGLLKTGLVGAVIPPEANTLNSFLPPGLVWLKASVEEDAGAVCSLVSVAANAIEVERRAGVDRAARLWTPLPAGSIARLKTPLAALKSTRQPFATFGGSALESGAALNTRVAERLRHRQRCISAWDYERAVLAEFPEIRNVKCIPHSAGDGAWTSPGHVLVVVVPDLRERNAVDPLRPRADADTLSRIQAHLERRAPMRLAIHVHNPHYQRIRLDFKVEFLPGLEFNHYARELRKALIEHLTPWARDPGALVSFGGAVYRSALLDFVEERDYVDYVTDFRMYDLRGEPPDFTDVSEARAVTPDAILVSDATHDIGPVPAPAAGGA